MPTRRPFIKIGEQMRFSKILTLVVLGLLALIIPGCSGSGGDGDFPPAQNNSPDYSFTVISKNSAGQIGNENSTQATVSGSGKHVAFVSKAANLVDGDNSDADIFIYDAESMSLIKVPFDHQTYETGEFKDLSVSADGQIFSFEFGSPYNGFHNIFIYDRTNSRISKVPDSPPPSPTRPDYTFTGNTNPFISANGRFLAYYSIFRHNLSNKTYGDIVVLDLHTTGKTILHISENGDLGRGFFYSNSDIINPSLSADGRYLTFESTDPNLVENDNNNLRDIFVYDTQTGITERMSVNNSGEEAAPFIYCVGGSDCVGAPPQGHSSQPSITDDGRFVVFSSIAKNLAGDPGICTDTCIQCRDCLTEHIFLHDRETKTTAAISTNSSGQLADSGSHNPVISGDGRYIALASDATDLVQTDQNGLTDIFLYDNVTKQLQLISRGTTGNQTDGNSQHPALARDGSTIVFQSTASTWSANGDNDFFQVILGAPQPFNNPD